MLKPLFSNAEINRREQLDRACHDSLKVKERWPEFVRGWRQVKPVSNLCRTLPRVQCSSRPGTARHGFDR